MNARTRTETVTGPGPDAVPSPDAADRRGAQGADTGTPHRDRWRDRPLTRFWAGSTISMLGGSLTALAVPVIAVRDLGAGAGQMGILAATGTGTAMLCRLPAAAWADASRRPATRVVAAGETLGGVLVALVPVLWLAHLLRFPVLVLVLAAATAVAVLVEGFAGPLLPRIVPPDRLAEANGRFMVSRGAAEVSGPGIGGLLLQVVSAPVLLVVDACSYLISGALTRSIKEPPREPVPSGGPVRSAAEAEGVARRERGAWRAGLVAVFADPFLRRWLLFVGGVSLGNGMAQALLVIVLLKTVGVRVGLVGLVLAVGAVGGVVGGAVIGSVRDRLGSAGTAALAAVLLVVSLAGLPFAEPGWFGVAVCVGYELVGSFGAVLMLVVVFSEIPGRIRPDRIGRALAMANLVPEAGGTAGALAGGILGTALGVRPALGIGFALAVAVGLTTAGGTLIAHRARERKRVRA